MGEVSNKNPSSSNGGTQQTDASNVKTEPSRPGEGIRSLRTSTLFRITNFELYARPNVIIMGLGLIGLTISVGYMAYMNTKYERMGLYTALNEDGQQTLRKKQSRWT